MWQCDKHQHTPCTGFRCPFPFRPVSIPFHCAPCARQQEHVVAHRWLPQQHGAETCWTALDLWLQPLDSSVSRGSMFSQVASQNVTESWETTSKSGKSWESHAPRRFMYSTHVIRQLEAVSKSFMRPGSLGSSSLFRTVNSCLIGEYRSITLSRSWDVVGWSPLISIYIYHYIHVEVCKACRMGKS